MTTQASLSTGVGKPLMRGATTVRETVVAYLSVVVPDVGAGPGAVGPRTSLSPCRSRGLRRLRALRRAGPVATARVNAASAGKFDQSIGYDDGAKPGTT